MTEQRNAGAEDMPGQGPAGRPDDASARAAEELRILTNLSPQTVWRAAPDGSVTFANAYFFDYTGLRPEQLQTDEWTQIIHSSQRDAVLARWHEAAGKAASYEQKVLLRRASDGAYRWNLSRGMPVLRSDGSIDYWIGTATDIHEQEVLSRRLALFDSLNEATCGLGDPRAIMAALASTVAEYLAVSGCAYADVDPDGEHFTIQHDYTRDGDSLAGHYRLSVFGEKPVSQLRRGATLTICNVDEEIPADEGLETFNAVRIKATISCPLVKEGALRAMMAVHQSTPRIWTEEEVQLVEMAVERSWAYIERARAEAALRESGERFQFLAESMPQKIFTAKPNGEVDYFNQQWTEFTGLAFEEIRDWGWTQFIHPEDVEENVRRWKHSIDTGELFEFEHRFRRADGEWRWHVSRARPLCDAEGRVQMWIGSNTEIHDVKVAQAEAENANRAKDSFLAMLSHELRTPLMPVLMSAAALETEGGLSPEHREQLSMMRRNVELEARLIDDLLDLTLISRGQMQLIPAPADIHSLLEHAEKIVAADAAAKDVKLRLELGAPRHHVVGDAARLQQVFWNLLKNALKYTDEGGTVTVRTEQRGDGHIAVIVRDTGAGIDPERKPFVFDAFAQAGTAGRDRRAGLGLGLSISRSIVEMHQGTISVQSEGKGRGTTVTVELNAVAAPSDANPSAPETARTGRVPHKLLVVEDHQPTLAVLAALLRRNGHEVVTAECVDQALHLAANDTFDLVISDIGLPDGNGVDLMRELTRRHGLRGIALSGYGMESDLARTRQAGFIAHLVKPVRFDQLHQALTRAAATV